MGSFCTPWGFADSIKDIGRGILRVGTPSHGGYFVPPELRAETPTALRNDDGFYEEDAEYAKVVLAFPDLFSSEERKDAEEKLINCDPDAALAIGLTATTENSLKLRRRAFNEAHKNDYVAVAAYGSWHKEVPKGMVGLFAVRGGRAPNGRYASNDAKSFLVPADEYETRTGDFVVDPARHVEIAAL